ncbi:MAG: prepilin-type N-terminal cleavage/methylation domain-containing protein [bacterium]|nr:prepilin-type N-terminal cleavage/methylation domain-containing protein [bacterium]
MNSFFLKKNKIKNFGFTLIEVMISISIFVIIVTIVYSTYNLAQRSYRTGGNDNELWQNARVVLDRATREIRQSQEIVTVLPPTSGDIINPPKDEIEFQDGHDTTDISYIKYYLDNASREIYREEFAYYFNDEPTIFVRWDSLDGFGNPPLKTAPQTQLIGEFFETLSIWGTNLINIAVTLEKNGQNTELITAVYGRNL